MSIELGGKTGLSTVGQRNTRRSTNVGVETRFQPKGTLHEDQRVIGEGALRRFMPAKNIRDRSFSHFRVDIAVPLTRLKDETWRRMAFDFPWGTRPVTRWPAG
jgi:hypothetical protein